MLLPPFQHVGAAAVKTIIEVFILGYLMLNVPRDMLTGTSVSILAKASVASAAMCGALYALRSQHLLLLVLAGAATYVIAGFALRLVPERDLRAFREALAVRRAPFAPRPGAGHRPRHSSYGVPRTYARRT